MSGTAREFEGHSSWVKNSGLERLQLALAGGRLTGYDASRVGNGGITCRRKLRNGSPA
jgi:hypothetical protein